MRMGSKKFARNCARKVESAVYLAEGYAEHALRSALVKNGYSSKYWSLGIKLFGKFHGFFGGHSAPWLGVWHPIMIRSLLFWKIGIIIDSFHAEGISFFYQILFEGLSFTSLAWMIIIIIIVIMIIYSS